MKDGTEEITFSVIGTIYDIAARHVMPVNNIEEVIGIPCYLTNEKKVDLYTYYIAGAYFALEKFQDAIDKFNDDLGRISHPH